ncbi:winged helix-turn-helix domain-containing protein [Haloferax chudinovii]|uniref:Winged helix-turn-helix domain-containing protein n=1 Tax=Haloferax chudinovii TaxID=1109010 RepID=A0ABD5XMJ1_9EURY
MNPLELLGSKARLSIFRALSRRDMYVSELMEEVGMDGKTATHHLEVLEEAGIVTARMEGRRKYYTLIREVDLTVSPSPRREFRIQFPAVPEQSGDST